MCGLISGSSIKRSVIAASLALYIIINGCSFANNNVQTYPTGVDPAGPDGPGGIRRADGGNVYMSYAGPVFPLSIQDLPDGITASRNINFDFSGFENTEKDEYGFLPMFYDDIVITDSYELLNNGREDRKMKIVYPFTGNFQFSYRYSVDSTVRVILLSRHL